MALATALLQPQRLARARVDVTAQLQDDVLRAITMLIEDALIDGDLARTVLRAGKLALPAVEQHLSAHLGSVRERLRLRVQPLLDGLLGFTGEVAAIGSDATRAVALLRRLLGLADGAATALSFPRVREAVVFVVDLLEKDLGVSTAFVQTQVVVFLDVFAEQLAPAPGDAIALRRKRLALIAVVKELRTVIAAQSALPRLQVDAIARLVFEQLEKLGLAERLAQARCAIDEFEASIAATAALGARIPGIAVGGSIGAALVDLADSATYAWYPSWLLGDFDLPLYGMDNVKDRVRLITRIRDVPDAALFQYLRREMPAELANAIVGVDAANPPSDELLLRMLAFLNGLLQGPLIYDRDLFATIAVGNDLRNELEAAIAEDSVLLANRKFFDVTLKEVLSTVDCGFVRFVGRKLHGVLDWPRNAVVVSADKRFVMCGDKPLKFGANLLWHDAPLFVTKPDDPRPPGQTFWLFEKVPPDVCEQIAHHSSWATSLGVAIWRLVDVVRDQPGHRIGSAIAVSIEFVEAVSQLVFGRPVHGFTSLGGFGRWLSSGVVGPRGIARAAGSFQGLHTVATAGNGFYFWLTVVLGDIIRAVGPSTILGLVVRDLALSSITLVNFGGPRSGPLRDDKHPAQNLSAEGPIDSLMGTLFGMALMAIYKREDHSIEIWSADDIGDRRLRAFLLWFIGAPAFGVFAATGTILLSTLLSWSKGRPDLGKLVGLNMLFMFLKYWVLEYLLKEGDTDGGTYNPRGPGKFKGYPNKDSSPYKLPYAKGIALYCGQANQGLWSHNDISNLGSNQQCYAYDFGHDHDEGVHAARSGIVWDFKEDIEDTDDSTRNIITIIHDVPDAEHDDPFASGTAIITYAEYLHGAKDGITRAFAQRGLGTPVAEKNSRGNGTRVNQGDLIMLADDTGKSFHSHLHMHVVLDSGNATNLAGAMDAGDLGIPFVFRDVRGDGRPKNLTWYESENG